MTDQLRALAEAEARKKRLAYPDSRFFEFGFIAGRTSVTREQIVRVLRRHEPGAPNGGTASWAWCKCSCGWEVRLAGMTRDYVYQLAEDHRADQVLALFGEVAGDE